LRYLYLLLRFPWSFLTFLVLFLGNTLCARRCHSTCGEACCYNPTQVAYIHSLYVIRQTLLKGWRRFLCCCISEGAGVLAVLWELDTPPRYIFDEDADTPVLLTFQEYLARVETGKVPVPPYSGKYRAIDGGGNQRIFPWIGQGGRGYAMNEPFQALRNLPSADEVVRLLYKRDAFKKAPYGTNSLATWFANVAIHDFFRTATGTDGETHPERGMPDSEQAGDAGGSGAPPRAVSVCVGRQRQGVGQPPLLVPRPPAVVRLLEDDGRRHARVERRQAQGVCGGPHEADPRVASHRRVAAAQTRPRGARSAPSRLRRCFGGVGAQA